MSSHQSQRLAQATQRGAHDAGNGLLFVRNAGWPCCHSHSFLVVYKGEEAQILFSSRYTMGVPATLRKFLRRYFRHKFDVERDGAEASTNSIFYFLSSIMLLIFYILHIVHTSETA